MNYYFFDFFIYPGRVTDITGSGFVGNVIRYYIDNCFSK